MMANTKSFATLALIFCITMGFCACAGEKVSDFEKRYTEVAKHKDWLENYRLGKRILRRLSSLGPEEIKKLDIAVYRGERVAFGLRPHSVGWEVMVCGEVLQVLPQNKIIVIEVSEKDWLILQTS